MKQEIKPTDLFDISLEKVYKNLVEYTRKIEEEKEEKEKEIAWEEILKLTQGKEVVLSNYIR